LGLTTSKAPGYEQFDEEISIELVNSQGMVFRLIPAQPSFSDEMVELQHITVRSEDSLTLKPSVLHFISSLFANKGNFKAPHCFVN
jgi:hypothetical protein